MVVSELQRGAFERKSVGRRLRAADGAEGAAMTKAERDRTIASFPEFCRVVIGTTTPFTEGQLAVMRLFDEAGGRKIVGVKRRRDGSFAFEFENDWPIDRGCDE